MEEDGWRGFLRLVRKARTEEELGELFWLFLTPTEKAEISTRFLIVQELLRDKLSQRQMAEKLGVSIAKITRGSNFLKMVNKDLRRLFS